MLKHVKNVFVQGHDGSKGDKGEVGSPGNPGEAGLRGKDVSKSWVAVIEVCCMTQHILTHLYIV